VIGATVTVPDRVSSGIPPPGGRAHPTAVGSTVRRPGAAWSRWCSTGVLTVC